MSQSSRYLVPSEVYQVEEEIQRSRFIATLARAETVEAAQAFLQEMREMFADATHNCWAYVVGPPGSTARVGMSDDGEPHGTAGRPMLNVLLHADVGEVVAVVTRYYGGTKLGKGGLVRAYGGAVQKALETLPTEEKVNRLSLVFTVAYDDMAAVRRLVEGEVAMEDEAYDADVTFTFSAPEEQIPGLREALTNLCAGRITFVADDTED